MVGGTTLGMVIFISLSLRYTYQYKRIGKFRFRSIERGERDAKIFIILLNFFVYLMVYLSIVNWYHVGWVTILENIVLLAVFIIAKRRIKSNVSHRNDPIWEELRNPNGGSSTNNSGGSDTKYDNASQNTSVGSSGDNTKLYDRNSDGKTGDTEIYGQKESVSYSGEGTQGSSSISYCPSCGKELSGSSSFCQSCGQNLSEY